MRNYAISYFPHPSDTSVTGWKSEIIIPASSEDEARALFKDRRIGVFDSIKAA